MKGNPRQSWILNSTPSIPDSRYWIPNRCQWDLGDSNPWWNSVFLELYSRFHKQKFPRIPESGFPYIGLKKFLILNDYASVLKPIATSFASALSLIFTNFVINMPNR